MKKQQGVALITALFIFTLCSIIATLQFTRAKALTRLTASHINRITMWQHVFSAEQYAIKILIDDLENDEKQKKIDHLQEPWAELTSFPLESKWSVKIKIEDANSRLNINALISDNEPNTEVLNVFNKLLFSQNIDESLSYFIIDWIDNNLEPQHSGGEDQFYLDLGHEYLPPNMPIFDPSEIYAISNISPKKTHTLLNSLRAWNDNEKININTANINILTALFNEENAHRIINARAAENGFKDLASFSIHSATAGTIIPQQLIDVRSDQFILHTSSQIRNTTLNVESIIIRNDTSKQAMVINRKIVPTSIINGI